MTFTKVPKALIHMVVTLFEHPSPSAAQLCEIYDSASDANRTQIHREFCRHIQELAAFARALPADDGAPTSYEEWLADLKPAEVRVSWKDSTRET